MFPLIVFSVILLLTDLYAFKGFSLLLKDIKSLWFKRLLKIFFWIVPAAVILSVYLVFIVNTGNKELWIHNGLHYIIGFTVVFYVPKIVFIVFHFLEDLIHLTVKLTRGLRFQKPAKSFKGGEKITRSVFITRLGVIVAAFPFWGALNGITRWRFNYNVIREKIAFPNLPEAFDGFRIVQISDLHIGGFRGYYDKLAEAVEIINSQNADAVFFTGDLVNNFSSELDGFTELLGGISSRYGTFSVLGNHDYGDYFQWSSKEAKERNMTELLEAKEKMKFRLLNNSSYILSKDDSEIAVIGVENWGLPPFPQYGDLEKALQGTSGYPFKMLLTHDPTHWDEEVLPRTDIDITFAGHTHGMQFGVETGNIKWSPIRRMYPRWGGLYREEDQFLYVNRGLGFTGFPGRVGMPPEITVIDLVRGDSREAV